MKILFRAAIAQLSLTLIGITGLGTIALSPATAQTETLGLCETQRSAVRIYREGDRLMMRAFDRVNGVTWLTTEARSEFLPQGISFVNNRGETTVQMFVPTPTNRTCFITIGNNPPEPGSLIQGDLGDRPPTDPQTVALCRGTRNEARIYTRNNQLMMRMTNLQDNTVWLDTAASRVPNPEGVDYFNERGEQTVRLFVSNNPSSPCFIHIGNNPPEQGTLIQ